MHSQEGRPARIKTVLGDNELLLQRFRGRESVSEPFEFTVDMLSENKAVDLKALLGTPVTLTLMLDDGSERHVHGRFRRLVQLEQGKDDLVAYQGEIVPWLWFLSLYSNCRIFQNKTVVEIVEQVFKDRGFSDYKLKLNGSYPKRDYCVQYRETDLNFISRLLEDEGIFYFFEHTENKHTLVLADYAAAVQTVPGEDKLLFTPSLGAAGETSQILTVVRAERVCSGVAALTDYDFEKPSLNLMSKVSGEQKYEVYDYPGGYTAKSDGERYSKTRLDELEQEELKVSGTSECRNMVPGYKFTLQQHYRGDMNDTYTLLSVEHQGGDNNYWAPGNESFKYTNKFEAIPAAVVYRPPRRTPKAVVQGVQTAVVVGPAGEEIYVDKYGRVKVQFFWDREGKKDENSSCWVRVSQNWAGKQWGWVTLPRIGQEVIVDFLEGDPDRPIITGRVYNAEQMPPYALPANQTQSGIKSRSSKGGGSADYNEIRFEDKKGSEMITIHAQKDMDTTVENNDTQLVQNNRKITVDGTHTETIKKDTKITITEGNYSQTINQGNRDILLKMGNEKTQLDMGNMDVLLKMGNQTTKLDLGKSEHQALQSIELKVGQSSVKLDQMGVTIKGMMINIEGTLQVQVKGLITQVNADAVLVCKGGITMIN